MSCLVKYAASRKAYPGQDETRSHTIDDLSSYTDDKRTWAPPTGASVGAAAGGALGYHLGSPLSAVKRRALTAGGAIGGGALGHRAGKFFH